ncbi:membrane protein [Actinomadura sp. NBRC 104412]|nr:membrane protein [Actinomadura sp. NBRC 104412]
MGGMVEEESTAVRRDPPSRLARVPEGRVLGGVCTGLGRYTGIDPIVFRVGFGILVLTQGQGILLYIAAALFMPAGPDRASVAEQLFRRRFDAPAVLSIMGALLCAIVALNVLGNGLAGLLGGHVSTGAFAVLTVLGLILLVAHGRGVDLTLEARAFPERLQGYPLDPSDQAEMRASTPVSLYKEAPSGGGLPEGMIDLATLSPPAAGATAATPEEDRTRRPHGSRDARIAKKRQGSPALTSITLLAAMAAAAAFWPTAQAHPAPEQTMILLSVALAVVGCGLLAGGWFRVRGLATVGTVLTCALLTTSVVAEAPPDTRYGEVEWRPTDTGGIQREYTMGAGAGRLDLTRLPLGPGQRVAVNVRVTVGTLDVTLPPGARVELDARVALGDLQVAARTISGPGARSREVLEPETPGVKNPPVIALRIRGRIGDVQVSRG